MMSTRLLRVLPVLAMTAVALTAGQVATASSSPRGAKGTADRSGVPRLVAIRPVLQTRPDVQLTSGLKSPDAAGYAVTPSALISAKATIKVPLITCEPSGNSGIAPGVYLIGYFSSYSGAYVFPYCENGRVIYDAGIAINGTQTIPFTVKPGDIMIVSISETTSKTSATVRDVTAGVAKSISGAGSDKTQALVGDGGVTFGGVFGGVPKFKSYPVSSVSVGGKALGSVHPVSVERVNGKTVQLVPTAITGGNSFKVVFKHN